jgi:hypothetical protein
MTNPPQVSITVRPSCLLVLSSGKLSHLYTPRTVNEATPLNGCLEVEETLVTATVWRLKGYKFTLHLMLIIISHPSLLLALGFFSFLSSANHQWRIKEASSVSALLLQREVLCLTMQKLHHQRHLDLHLHRGPRQRSCRTAAAHQCSSRAVPQRRLQ